MMRIRWEPTSVGKPPRSWRLVAYDIGDHCYEIVKRDDGCYHCYSSGDYLHSRATLQEAKKSLHRS